MYLFSLRTASPLFIAKYENRKETENSMQQQHIE